MQVSKTAIVLLALMLAIPMFAAAKAEAATFSLDVTPTKSAYYVGETVALNAKLTWDGVDSEIGLDFQLWNSTAKLADLSHYTVSAENGSYNVQLTTNLISAKAGAATYNVKAVENTTGLTVAQDSFNIVVQDKSLMISVAWNDASNDRKIDVQEQVTFTIYVTWAFANATENYALKVNDQGVEKLIDTVAVAAGSGTATKTYVTSFDSAGAKTITFWLEDSEGKTVTSKIVTLNIGATQPESHGSFLDTLNNYANKYLGIILMFVAILIILILWKTRR